MSRVLPVYSRQHVSTQVAVHTLAREPGGTKEHVYLTTRQYTIIIYTAQRIVRILSLRLNKTASATATEMIFI